MTSRILTLALFLFACDEAPQTLDEVVDDVVESDPGPFDPERVTYSLTGDWEASQSLTLATGDHHEALVWSYEGEWTTGDEHAPSGDLMTHLVTEGRYGVIATVEPLNGTTLCQYRAGASHMIEITGSRCGLASQGCDPVERIHVAQQFYSEEVDDPRIEELRIDLELNAYRVTDADGNEFEMIVHDRGFVDFDDSEPASANVEFELLPL